MAVTVLIYVTDLVVFVTTFFHYPLYSFTFQQAPQLVMVLCLVEFDPNLRS